MARLLSDSERDDVAREAARLLRDGRAPDVAGAIRAALRERPGAAEVPLALVREHARGLALEALGLAGYRQQIAGLLERAEETMTLLATQLTGKWGTERATPVTEARAALVGRSARGQLDADPCCRIRIETDAPIGEIAALLVSAGVEEPTFSTIETRFGRLDQLSFDDEGLKTKVTRCPPGCRVPLDADLKQTGRVPSMDLQALRQLLLALRGDHLG
jgi:hypothetical protein